jgi:galactitol-specific phosphotransferase system IIB component
MQSTCQAGVIFRGKGEGKSVTSSTISRNVMNILKEQLHNVQCKMCIHQICSLLRYRHVVFHVGNVEHNKQNFDIWVSTQNTNNN